MQRKIDTFFTSRVTPLNESLPGDTVVASQSDYSQRDDKDNQPQEKLTEPGLVEQQKSSAATNQVTFETAKDFDTPFDISSGPNDEPFQPILNSYPKRNIFGKMRSFSSFWYKKYSLLEYSKETDMVYCFACRHFASKTEKISSFVTGYNNWGYIGVALTKHCSETNSKHQFALQAYSQFKSAQVSGSVNAKLSHQSKEQVERNRKVLLTHVEAVLFCAMQEIALRGHREDTTFADNSNSDSKQNNGNFLALLEFTKKKCPEYRQAIQQMPQNAKYVHHDIQNDIIISAAKLVRKMIKDEVGSGLQAYSVIADETRDNSGTEQLCLAIRYVTNGNVLERFLGYTDLHEFDAENISTGIKKLLNEVELPLASCVAQAYDGASVMSGVKNGVNAKIASEVGGYCPYVHCYAHRLNLALQDACKDLSEVGELLSLLQSIYNFQCNSVILSEVFCKAQTSLGYKNVLKMPQGNSTRWGSKGIMTSYFWRRYDAVVLAIETIIQIGKPNQVAEAKGYKGQLDDFRNLILLGVIDSTLQLCNSLSEYLQSSDLVFVRALDMCCSIKDILSSRKTPEEFEKLWDSAVEIANKVNIDIPSKENLNEDKQGEPPTKRRRMVSKFLAEYEVSSTLGQRTGFSNTRKDLYKNSQKLFFAVIDTFISTMDDRLSSNAILLKALSAAEPKSKTFLDIPSVQSICDKFSRFDLDFDSMQANLLLVKSMLIQAECTGILECYRYLLSLGAVFSEWTKFFQLLLCIPVANASGERSFSTLKRIKDKLRTTMGEDRISNLSMLSMERDLTDKIYQDPLQVVEEFSKLHHRRLNFSL